MLHRDSRGCCLSLEASAGVADICPLSATKFFGQIKVCICYMSIHIHCMYIYTIYFLYLHNKIWFGADMVMLLHSWFSNREKCCVCICKYKCFNRIRLIIFHRQRQDPHLHNEEIRPLFSANMKSIY